MNQGKNHKKLNEQSSMAAERQDAVRIIQSLQQEILRLYHVYPVFCIGGIQDVLDSAFTSNSTRKYRPLLIYIHHDNTVDLFCSPILIEFLEENYIVWPWNITDTADRERLIKMWQENFPEEFSINFSMDLCPMLIGVIRPFTLTNDSFPEYIPEILLIDNVLVRTYEELDLETLLYQLIVFKEEFNKNERYLSCHFVHKIVPCLELVIEISEYLSLNDAAATFSSAVLPLLWRYHRHLPVIQPSEEFLRRIIRQNDQDKIFSLGLKADQFKQLVRLFSTTTFLNVQSLDISEMQQLSQIRPIKIYFFNITYLSLHYDEVDVRQLSKIVYKIPSSVKRFNLHCKSIRCSHYLSKLIVAGINNPNTTLESIVLIVNYTSRSLVNQCLESDPKCVLRTITNFIEIMCNLRRLRVMTNGSIEALLGVVQWKVLMEMCRQLDKIKLKGMRNMLSDRQLLQKTQEIENELHAIRQSHRFDVRVH